MIPLMAQTGSISGGVWDAVTSQPIAGAEVFAIGQNDTAFTYTDSSGMYILQDLEPGIYTVFAHASGYNSATIPDVHVYPGQNTPNINFYLQPLNFGSISGWVYEQGTNQPLANVHIFTIAGPSYGEAWSDTSGAYQISNLLPGTYCLKAYLEGYSPEIRCSIVVNEGQNTPDINFWLTQDTTPDFGSISGAVYDATTGLPIPQAHLIAYGPSQGEAWSDSIGRYKIENLLEGIYVVEAHAPGYQVGVKDSIPVLEGQNTPGIDFYLSPISTDTTGITGMVTNALTNQPILGACVKAVNNSDTFLTYTDYNGKYFLSTSPGTYLVKASAPGFESSVYPESITVNAGEIVSGINFALQPDTQAFGGISGRVTDETTGLPIYGATIFAYGINGQGEGISDTNGFYLISNLPPGNYTVRASAVGYYPQTYPEDVEVTAGEITPNIDFALLPCDTGGVYGFVIDGQNGNSVNGAQITLIGPSGTIQTQTDERGDYIIENLEEGTYTLTVQAVGYESYTYPEPIYVFNWIKSFICPTISPLLKIKENSILERNKINLMVSPNPATKYPVITFSIGKEGKVKLRIYDVSGKLVKELLNQKMKPGKYSILWDKKDRKGKMVGSGIYFYRIEIENARKVVKGILF